MLGSKKVVLYSRIERFEVLMGSRRGTARAWRSQKARDSGNLEGMHIVLQ